MTTAYTDGACVGNPGPGGWAWAILGGAFASGAEPHTTNQRMELAAVLEAMRAIDGPLTIVSDSTYVVNCFRDRWWEGWLARGWLNKAKKPVANRDLWEPLIDLYVAREPRPQFRWVKGHGGDPGNDLVDRLAVEAARAGHGREGGGPPDLATLGAGDDPRAGTYAASGPRVATDPRVPAGFRVVVGGHRPPELGGYGPNPVATAVVAKLTEVLGALIQVHADAVVLTGMGLGAEQMGAEAARAAGVPYAAVLPFPEQEAVWPQGVRQQYSELLAGAREQVLIQNRRPESREKAGAALRRRDGWLARNGNEAVIVFDGADPATGRLVRSLRDALGEEQVWVIDPPSA